MNIDKWTSNDNCFDMLEFIKDKSSEKIQCKISCKFCRLIWDNLTDFGKESLLVTEKLARSEVDKYTCDFYLKKLQALLPKDEKTYIYSPIIWALTNSDDSCPAWYTAGIAGSNVEEITGLSSKDLCNVIRNNINPFEDITCD